MTEAAAPEDQAYAPRILVFSTNNISDPGIDLAGSSHMHYSPQRHGDQPARARAASSRAGSCTPWSRASTASSSPPTARSAPTCPDCSERTAGIMTDAQDAARREGLRAAARAHGRDLLGLRGAVHQLHARVRRRPCRAWGRPGRRPHDRAHRSTTLWWSAAASAGMESALKLGDMGYKVLVVEKDASVGGKMILLSKVFPTLDCASCISTPKMAATIHHPNIDVLTYAEVEGIRGNGDGTLPRRRSRRSRSSSTRPPAPAAASARWPATSPSRTSSTPTWSRGARPTSPSRRRCRRRPSSTAPASRRAPTSAPPASRRTATSRACAAASTSRPSTWCSRRRRSSARSDARATRRARSSARAASSRARCRSAASSASSPTGTTARPSRSRSRSPSRTARRSPSWARARPASPPPGSSPARATASRSSSPRRRPGGMLRLGIPAYRLPNDVIDDDIANVTAIGVEIETGTRVDDVAALKDDGFDAVLRGDRHAQGRPAARARRGPRTASRAPSPSSPTSSSASPSTWPARRSSWSAAATSPSTRRAPRAASAPRRSTRSASSAARRCPPTTSRSRRPRPRASRCTTAGASTTSSGDGSVQRAEIKVCTCVFDPDGRFHPEYDESQRDTIDCDVVIVAAGMGADTEAFGLETNPQPDAQGRPGHAADRRAARLRRRRRRHRPDDDHHRRRPGPPRRLHDRPLPAGRDARRCRCSTSRWRRRQERACSRRQDVYDRREPLESQRRR